jgi:DNA polymerase-3 subunit epsilon
MVGPAPSFEEVAGDLLAVLCGSIWTGHNIAFDLQFLRAEYARLGVEIPEVPSLCTMNLFGYLGPAAESHKLCHVCAACGVTNDCAHSALSDARATAQVLAYLLRESRDFEVSSLVDLGRFGVSRVDLATLKLDEVALSATGKRLTRQQASEEVLRSRGSYIADLVQRLRPTVEISASEWPLGLYLNLLDRVLEDRRVEEHERDYIWRLAQEWDLTMSDAERAHRIYLGMLVDAAMADEVVTDAEIADLEAVADLLAVPREELSDFMGKAQPLLGAAHPTKHIDSPRLAGLSVCFTGNTPGPSGLPISRAEATEIAEVAGLVVQRNVTKKLDLLVVADPDTQSGKARKARDYGIRILAAPVFWQKLGIT